MLKSLLKHLKCCMMADYTHYIKIRLIIHKCNAVFILIFFFHIIFCDASVIGVLVTTFYVPLLLV